MSARGDDVPDSDAWWRRGGGSASPYAAAITAPHDPAPTPPPPRRRWRRFILPGLGIFAALFIALILWLVITAPLGRALEPSKQPSLVLLDSDGRPIARRGDYKEPPVDVAKLPKYVPAALIAIEDRRFYQHWASIRRASPGRCCAMPKPAA